MFECVRVCMWIHMQERERLSVPIRPLDESVCEWKCLLVGFNVLDQHNSTFNSIHLDRLSCGKFCHVLKLFQKWQLWTNAHFHIKTVLHLRCDFNLLLTFHTPSYSCKETLSAHNNRPKVKSYVRTRCEIQPTSSCRAGLQIATVCVNTKRKETELSMLYKICHFLRLTTPSVQRAWR